MTLDEDPRWQRLTDRSYTCPCCGQSYGGIFDIGCDHPDPWPYGALGDTDQTVLTVGADRLGTDLCEIGDQGYVRGTLPLPIQVTDQVFSFGVWVSLQRDNFMVYAMSFQDEQRRGGTGLIKRLRSALTDCLKPRPSASPLKGCFGWLSNRLPGFDVTDFLPCDVLFQEDNTRPQIWVHEDAHPLATRQREGISFDHLLDFYAKAGTDLGPHLGHA